MVPSKECGASLETTCRGQPELQQRPALFLGLSFAAPQRQRREWRHLPGRENRAEISWSQGIGGKMLRGRNCQFELWILLPQPTGHRDHKHILHTQPVRRNPLITRCLLFLPPTPPRENPFSPGVPRQTTEASCLSQ